MTRIRTATVAALAGLALVLSVAAAASTPRRPSAAAC